MTIRELMGFTPNMGVFEIAEAWPQVPQSVKALLPAAVVQSMDALVMTISAYNLLITTYNTMKTTLDLLNQAQISASLPPNPATAAGVAAKEAAKIAMSQAASGLTNSGALIQLALDQNIPL